MTMFQAAIAWQVFQISGSTIQLGLIGLARFAPQLLLTLVAGAVADSYDRRKVILLAQITPFICSLALFSLTVSHLITLPWIYVLVVLVGIASAFDQPSRQSLLPQLVPVEVFPRAVTVASSATQLAFVVGPTVGGLLIARYSVAGAYATYAMLILLSWASLWKVKPRFASRGRRGISVEAIKEGLTFLRRNQVAFGAMTLDMFAVIFGGATALLPVYATKILHVGAGGYGLLTSALGIGALTMSMLLMVTPQVKRTGATMICTVAVFGLMTMVFGISRTFVFSLIAYALTGAADQVSVVMRQAAIQLTTPDELRGRVNAVNSLFVGASGQVGAIESGLVAALTNATFAVVSGGAACIGVVGIVAVTMPELRHYRIDQADHIVARALGKETPVASPPSPLPAATAGEDAAAGD
jgi:MFS family permease